MNPKAGSLALIAFFMLSTLATPLALAETAVGVLYRDWTLAECQKEFGASSQYLTTQMSEVGTTDTDLQKYKGPLVTDRGIETGCYCKAERIMNTQKNTCVECKLFTNDNNAVYYTEATASKEPQAKITNPDNTYRGCVCAAKKGDDVFIGFNSDGKCQYAKFDSRGKSDIELCKYYYGDTAGVITCTGVTGETKLPSQTPYAGKTLDNCCCGPGTKKEPSTDNIGGFECKAPTSRPGQQASDLDLICAAEGKANGISDALVACPDNLILKDMGGYSGTYDRSTASAALTAEYKRRAVPNLIVSGTNPYHSKLPSSNQVIPCCCAENEVYEDGKCKPLTDACTTVVPGSISKDRATADNSLLIDSDYSRTGRSWDPKLLAELSTKGLSCACQIGTLPYGSDTSFTECKVAEEGVVFQLKTPNQFMDIFATTDGGGLLNKVASGELPLDGASRAKCVRDGLCDGILLKSPVVFFNEDASRRGRIFAMAAGAVVETVTGGLLIKNLAKKGIGITAKTAAEMLTKRLATQAADHALVAGAVKAAVDDVGAEVAARSGAKILAEGEAERVLKYAVDGGLSMFIHSIRTSLDQFMDLLAKQSDDVLESVVRLLGGTPTPGYREAMLVFIRSELPSASADTLKTVAERVAGTAIRDAATEALIKQGASKGLFLSLENIGSVIRIFGWTAATASTVAFDDVIWSTPSKQPSRTMDVVVACGAGAAVGAVFGFGVGSWLSAPIGCVLSGANEFFTGEADPTNMFLWAKGNMAKDREVENLLISPKKDTCVQLESGSSLSTKEMTFTSNGPKVDIYGWALRSIGWSTAECGIGNAWQKGAGFMVLEPVIEASGIDCTGCELKKDPRFACGKRNYDVSTQTAGYYYCCDQCIVISNPEDSKNLMFDYRKMPQGSTTAATSSGGVVF